MNINKNTFGDSEAAIVLAKILNKKEDANQLSYVSSTWSQYNEYFNHYLEKVDKKYLKTTLSCLRKAFLERVEFSKLDTEVKTYLKNIMVTKFKKEFRAL